jgi:hypothetical protein
MRQIFGYTAPNTPAEGYPGYLMAFDGPDGIVLRVRTHGDDGGLPSQVTLSPDEAARLVENMDRALAAGAGIAPTSLTGSLGGAAIGGLSAQERQIDDEALQSAQEYLRDMKLKALDRLGVAYGQPDPYLRMQALNIAIDVAKARLPLGEDCFATLLPDAQKIADWLAVGRPPASLSEI